jgi:ferric-dicitrate binding protein FerR (iron transport regulator)
MPKIKKQAARKAAKMAAKHTVHGTASKARREPLRSTTLLALGAVVGAIGGWLAKARGPWSDRAAAPGATRTT